ncbi:MAG TPA: YggS family pyridoxal phosphate-dependent enzyme [Candidatus Limnocylindria bacterium]|nr:YggS family pyridoxal phosphate-dependent enzyme [Candidatus Limnocylindria bacterium]
MSDPRLLVVRKEVVERIAAAAHRAKRDPSEVAVVAVTKTVAADRIRAAIDAGFTELGENRVQERAAKAAEVEVARGPRWHLVGPLQSNKARRAVELFDVIQTVDSLDLARRLDRIAAELHPGRPIRVLVQVNVDDDGAKSGYAPADVERDLAELMELEHLAVDGLMTVGRLVETAEQARPTFVALRRLSERLRARHGGLGAALSMGMSEDFEVAVEEGATLVRIGRAIFGARPPVG